MTALGAKNVGPVDIGHQRTSLSVVGQFRIRRHLPSDAGVQYSSPIESLLKNSSDSTRRKKEVSRMLLQFRHRENWRKVKIILMLS